MPSERIYNFSAGPAALPLEVLEQVRAELLNWRDSGSSVMEISHRGAAFGEIVSTAEEDLRKLLNIGEEYAVLFMQGGAQAQFGLVPLNLLGDKSSMDYANTGQWSRQAMAEAEKYGEVRCVVSTVEAEGKIAVPPAEQWRRNEDAAYLHYTPNETIDGVEFSFVPDSGGVPLVADMSSTILSRPLDVSRFGLIYAGAQKNIGPPGITLVIVRRDLLDRAHQHTPSVFNYEKMARANSLLNTPPTFSWYVASLVFRWLLNQGGLQGAAERNHRKAKKLYEYIDSEGFYQNKVHPDWRSWMNVPFFLADERRNAEFLRQSEQAGLLYLKGHRKIGGMRASLYNAVPEASVDALIAFMKDFAANKG